MVAVSNFVQTAGGLTNVQLRSFCGLAEEKVMDKDRVEGSAKQVKGAVKETIGKVVGDAKLEAEGKADETEGKVQNAIGGLKDAVRDAAKKSPDPRSQPRPVGVDRFPGRVVAMPAKIALGRLGLGDARLPYAAVERLQRLARMITLVGDQHAGLVLARREADLAEIARGDFESRRKRRRVAFVGRMDRRRHHDARVEIDRVLGLVGQMRRPVLHSGDLRLGVGRAL